MKLSLFDRVTNPIPLKETNLKTVIKDIQEGKYSAQIKNVRLYINDKPKRDIEKKKLPLISFAGTFSQRSNFKLIQSSGVACLDYDNCSDLNQLKNEVNNDNFTFCSFVSPSGNGLKVLVKIPFVDNDEDYKSFYLELQKHYNRYGVTDESTKDISRASFVSYDSELYLNVDAETFTDRYVIPEYNQQKVIFKIDDENEVAQRLLVWFKKHWTTGQNRNNNLFKLCSAFNDYGVSQSIALDYCMQYQSKDFSRREIESLVKSAYKNTFNFGTKAFEDEKKVITAKRLVRNNASKEDLKNKLGEIEGIEEVINEKKQTEGASVFWEVTDKGRIKINYVLLDQYLKANGISKYYPFDESSHVEFITKDDNFIDWIDPIRIKDFIKKDLLSKGHYDVWEYLARNTGLFKTDALTMLDTIEIQPKRDTAKSSFIYYKNKVIKTTKDKIEELEYKDIDEVIWRKQVIDRNVTVSNESDGEFKTFIWKLSGEQKDRYYTLKSVIGYLLHSHQNTSKPKAIIFNDEMLSDDIPNGGSGKGLIHKAIGHIKNIVVENGKKFDSKGQFAYSRVNKDTQIFLMDDVPKSFNFEDLFSIITEGMVVEKKGKDAFKIDFEESPKISITTNYTVKGEGASHYRRIFEVEIANYFNDKHTPEDEFGHQFFTDWSEAEWQRFDNFMIRCIQYYLNNGLVESNKVNLELRKLRHNLGFEFMEYMETNPFKERKSRKEARDDFNRLYPNLSRYNTAQKFNKKVKSYCEFHNLELVESKYNGVDTWQIVEDEEDKLWSDAV